jgi:hypothetical protein
VVILTDYSSPVSLAVFVPAHDPAAWRIVNVTTFTQDLYTGPVPDADHLLPMTSAPKPGVTEFSRWCLLPSGLVIPGAFLYALAADLSGSVVASPGSVLWDWVISVDDPNLCVRFSVGR